MKRTTFTNNLDPELRKNYITSTDIAALFGLHPYKTEFDVFLEKSGELVPEENRFMRVGKKLEPTIAALVEDELKISLKPKKEFIAIDDLKIASSFDYEDSTPRIFEIKNVSEKSFETLWEEKLPRHVELQVQHQLFLSEIDEAVVCAFVGGNDLKFFNVSKDSEISELIIRRVEKFWNDFEKKQLPKIDFKKDYEKLLNFFKRKEKKIVFSNPEIDNLLNEYSRLSEERKVLDERIDEIRAKITLFAQDAEVVEGNSHRVIFSKVPETKVEYLRKEYTQLRILKKRGGKI